MIQLDYIAGRDCMRTYEYNKKGFFVYNNWRFNSMLSTRKCDCKSKYTGVNVPANYKSINLRFHSTNIHNFFLFNNIIFSYMIFETFWKDRPFMVQVNSQFPPYRMRHMVKYPKIYGGGIGTNIFNFNINYKDLNFKFNINYMFNLILDGYYNIAHDLEFNLQIGLCKNYISIGKFVTLNIRDEKRLNRKIIQFLYDNSIINSVGIDFKLYFLEMYKVMRAITDFGILFFDMLDIYKYIMGRSNRNSTLGHSRRMDRNAYI